MHVFLRAVGGPGDLITKLQLLYQPVLPPTGRPRKRKYIYPISEAE